MTGQQQQNLENVRFGSEWAKRVNDLDLQTGLSARYSVKGFSGPLTNLALQPNAASPSAWDNAPGRNEKPISAVGGYPGASLAERSSWPLRSARGREAGLRSIF